MSVKTYDETKAEAFVEQMVSVLNNGALALMVSIGHQTGLFEAMAERGPSTSTEIAESAGLNERYVREWLGAVVTGGIVEYDPTLGTYYLPPEHAACLTSAAGGENLALQCQFIPMMAEVEQPVIECFRNGGGVPYSAFTRFHKIMAEDSGAVHDASLIETILPLVPGLIDRLEAGIDVLDVGCGSGHAINLMAKAFPRSRFTGYDMSKEGIGAAIDEADSLGLTNARFAVRDAAHLAKPDQYDFITTFDAVHDQARPDLVLAEIARALRPGGIYLMVDIAASSHLHENRDHPIAPYLYAISCMHCMTVSLSEGGMGLGTVWGEQKALEMLAEAGFTHVDIARIDGDIINVYYVATKG